MFTPDPLARDNCDRECGRCRLLLDIPVNINYTSPTTTPAQLLYVAPRLILVISSYQVLPEQSECYLLCWGFNSTAVYPGFVVVSPLLRPHYLKLRLLLERWTRRPGKSAFFSCLLVILFLVRKPFQEWWIIKGKKKMINLFFKKAIARFGQRLLYSVLALMILERKVLHSNWIKISYQKTAYKIP